MSFVLARDKDNDWRLLHVIEDNLAISPVLVDYDGEPNSEPRWFRCASTVPLTETEAAGLHMWAIHVYSRSDEEGSANRWRVRAQKLVDAKGIINAQG